MPAWQQIKKSAGALPLNGSGATTPSGVYTPEAGAGQTSDSSVSDNAAPVKAAEGHAGLPCRARPAWGAQRNTPFSEIIATADQQKGCLRGGAGTARADSPESGRDQKKQLTSPGALPTGTKPAEQNRQIRERQLLSPTSWRGRVAEVPAPPLWYRLHTDYQIMDKKSSG